jgi:hypothetical protein
MLGEQRYTTTALSIALNRNPLLPLSLSPGSAGGLSAVRRDGARAREGGGSRAAAGRGCAAEADARQVLAIHPAPLHQDLRGEALELLILARFIERQLLTLRLFVVDKLHRDADVLCRLLHAQPATRVSRRMRALS